MKECRKDGHRWEDEYDFCPYCGTMLHEVNKEEL